MSNWKHLTIEDLRTILSEKELQQLNSYSINTDITNVVNSTIDLVAASWRGALSAKGYTLDNTTPYQIPITYAYYVLVHARHAIWSRFPESSVIALDDARTKEYEEALKLLKDPFLDVPPIDPSENPEEDSSNQSIQGTGASSIFVPLQQYSNWYLNTTAEDITLSNYL